MAKVRYSLKLANKICQRLENCETLTAICKDEDMPNERTVYRWVRDIDGFREMYNTARQTQVYKWSDEMMDLTNAPLPLIKEEMVAEKERRRLRIDALKFQIAKGVAAMRDNLTRKIQVEHSGEVQGPQIVVTNYAQPAIDQAIEEMNQDESTTH